MKYITVFLVILGLMFAGCAAPKQVEQAQEQSKPIEYIPDVDTQKEVQEEESADTTVIVVKETSEDNQPLDLSWKQRLSTSLGEIITRAESKAAKGYKFILDTDDNVAEEAKYTVLGNQWKIDVFNKNIIPKKYSANKMNVIYVDFDSGKAIGICDRANEASNIRCFLEDEGKEFEMEAKDFDIILPYEQLSQLKEATSKGTQKFDDRNVVSVSATFIDGMEGEMYLDQFSGIPVRVEKAGEVTEYRQLTLGVVASEVTYKK